MHIILFWNAYQLTVTSMYAYFLDVCILDIAYLPVSKHSLRQSSATQYTPTYKW